MQLMYLPDSNDRGVLMVSANGQRLASSHIKYCCVDREVVIQSHSGQLDIAEFMLKEAIRTKVLIVDHPRLGIMLPCYDDFV